MDGPPGTEIALATFHVSLALQNCIKLVTLSSLRTSCAHYPSWGSAEFFSEKFSTPPAWVVVHCTFTLYIGTLHFAQESILVNLLVIFSLRGFLPCHKGRNLTAINYSSTQLATKKIHLRGLQPATSAINTTGDAAPPAITMKLR